MDATTGPEDGTEPEDAPEETKTTFWGGVADFFTMLLCGVP